MYKQLAKNGTRTKIWQTRIPLVLQCTNASVTTCNSNYIKTNEISCATLDMPTSAPLTTLYAGTTYFGIGSKKLYISDGTKKADNVTYNWYSVTLTLVP